MTQIFRLRPRRDCAKSQSSNALTRVGLAAFAVASSAFIYGCGGGGGGATTTPVVATPAVVINKPVITILSVRPTGTVANTSPITVDVKIEPAADSASLSLTATCNGSPVALTVSALPATGGQVSATPTSGTLPDGTSCDVGVKVTAANTSGSAPEASGSTNFIVPPKAFDRIYYDRANLVISGEVFSNTGNDTLGVGYPQLIVGKTRIMLKNETGFQVGGCMLSSGLLGQEAGVFVGLPSAECKKPSNGNGWAIFPIDPVGKRLLPEYKGPLPPWMVYYAGAYSEFGVSPYTQYEVSRLGKFIDVPMVGTYYFTDSNGNELRLTTDVFNTYEVLQTGETFKLLMTYSNPAPTN